MRPHRPRSQRRRVDSAGRSAQRGNAGNPVVKLLIWESEVRAIVREAARWSKETGGDLFGLWTDTPTIYLATLAGPKAVREAAHFRLDVEYLRELSVLLSEDWGLRYFGDWHSHHSLGLESPSGGDQRRITNIAKRNNFDSMAEVIVTFDDSPGRGHAFPVRLHPWMYRSDRTEAVLQDAVMSVMPGVSPVREALMARGVLPEQNLNDWAEAPSTRVRIGEESEPPVLVTALQGTSSLLEGALADVVAVLERASGRPVEVHHTPFGQVLVAAVEDERSIAFAVDRSWPPQILEVDAIDRISGKASPLQVPIPPSLLKPDDVAELYRKASEMAEPTEERRDVDPGSA